MSDAARPAGCGAAWWSLRRVVRRVAVGTALLLLAVAPAAAPAQQVSDPIQRINIHATAIEAFEPRQPARVNFGALTFRGGLVLESPYRHFGGLSALRVEADGQHFLSLTDKGYWLRGRIVSRGGRPIAIADAEMAPILGTDGRPLNRRGWYDSEALAVDDGIATVGIERVHQIVRFNYGQDGLQARGQPIAAPAAMKSLPSNKGIECLVGVPKSLVASGAPPAGTLIAIAERGLDARGNLLGFLMGPSDGGFTLKRRNDFDVSDCAVTPRGDLLVLERRFTWLGGVAMRIRSVPLAAVKAGALLNGVELMTADMGQQIDNMEGLSVHRAAGGALVLTLVSDNNFSFLQRTLLLQFTLVEE